MSDERTRLSGRVLLRFVDVVVWYGPIVVVPHVQVRYGQFDNRRFGEVELFR